MGNEGWQGTTEGAKVKKRYLGYLMVFLLLGGIIGNFKMRHKNTQHENLDCWIGEYGYTESFVHSEENNFSESQ